MKMIRIAHIVDSLDTGGLENGIVNLVNSMDPSGFRSIVICKRREGQLRTRLKEEIEVVCLNEKPGFHLMSFSQIARLCREKHIDVVHTHGWNGGLYCGLLGAKIAGVPVVINGEHGVVYADKFLLRLVQTIFLNFVDMTICVSRKLEEKIAKLFSVSPKRLCTIHNGVDVERFKPDPDVRIKVRQELKVGDEDFLVGTVGRLVSVKDHASLIMAAGILKKQLPHLRIILVGDGPLREELRHYVAKLGLEKSVIFSGRRNDVSRLLNAMDLFVLPSKEEGLSNTILEAMACGKHVIATRVGGNVELVEDGVNGRLIPAEAPEILSRFIFDAANNRDLLLQMGVKGREFVLDHFDLFKMIQKYEEAYVHLLSLKIKRTKASHGS